MEYCHDEVICSKICEKFGCREEANKHFNFTEEQKESLKKVFEKGPSGLKIDQCGGTGFISDDDKDPVDRFDLEDAIMRQLDITDNLEVLVQNIMDNGVEVDRVVNVLNGIIELHKMKNEQLFDIFTAVFELDEYSK